jgi:hypothetical protein
MEAPTPTPGNHNRCLIAPEDSAKETRKAPSKARSSSTSNPCTTECHLRRLHLCCSRPLPPRTACSPRRQAPNGMIELRRTWGGTRRLTGVVCIWFSSVKEFRRSLILWTAEASATLSPSRRPARTRSIRSRLQSSSRSGCLNTHLLAETMQSGTRATRISFGFLRWRARIQNAAYPERHRAKTPHSDPSPLVTVDKGEAHRLPSKRTGSHGKPALSS